MLLLIALTILSIWYFWSSIVEKIRFLYLTSKVPCYPGAWPIIGHALHFIGKNRVSVLEFTKLACEFCEENNGLCTVWTLTEPQFVITDPNDAYTVLTTCYDKNPMYSFGKPIFGDGLLTGPAAIWRKHRRLLNSSFSPLVLNTFNDIFNRQARKLVEIFGENVGKTSFDAQEHINQSTLEAICQTAIGVPSLSDIQIFKKYLTSCGEIQFCIATRTMNFWMHPSFLFKFTKVKKLQDKAIKKFQEIAQIVIDKKRAEININDVHNQNQEIGIKCKPFLQLLIELTAVNGVFSDEEIWDEVNTMVAAGHDTTAATLLIGLVLIGSHHKVQDKIYEELIDVFGNSDRDVEKSDLVKMKYLEATINEVIRLQPIGTVVGRKTDQELKLSKYTLPKGSSCLIPIRGIQRSKLWGPDADEFKPERWFDASTFPQHPAAFCGFSVGKRMCIGKSYAIMFLKIALSHILRKYRVTADHTKMQLIQELTLRSESGHLMQIELRKNEF